ncbi:helix-turn-helix transcriptional regulator [Vibrio mangrovi]|uniref:Helix-turn-helix domain protein n=1 Tax=Vibrio mangrovi TaxID=474394 RepID=A0A1Y6J2F0_9VIBR|nr:metalloregulator ArsR/SmtB family transcription factor [Vibrio mangrovi]MDW6002711.1 metalloregulator ArsR/SmtB family transcription factor [Vibrio mangrovi]SMS02872.1 Helix-turn-helix domain protein [Vibrio mangrovi]
MKTADKILHTLKREGAVTAKQLSERFGMTTMGARQHLQTLEEDGLVRFYDVKVKVGRPTRHWTLTANGHAYFADRHGELTLQVIDAVEQVYGSEGIAKIAATREAQTLAQYHAEMQSCMTLEEKLEMLVVLREREGYMVELETSSDGYRLIENHCPICKAATRCQSFCQSELNIFQSLLEGLCSVERQEHIVSGHRRCSYIIKRLN